MEVFERLIDMFVKCKAGGLPLPAILLYLSFSFELKQVNPNKQCVCWD